MKIKYNLVAIKERIPDIENLVNERLILLDENKDPIRLVYIGLMTDWELISNKASYWLEKEEIHET